jgi:hypothetical protein
MAIRRREPRLQLKMQHKLQQFIGTLGDIIVRSNLVAYTYQENTSIALKTGEIHHLYRGSTQRFSQLHRRYGRNHSGGK